MLTVAVPKRNKLPNIIVLTPKDGFSFTVVRVLSGGIWFMKYRFVIWPMLAACPFLILFGIVVPYLAYAPQRKNSLVEEIRKNE